MGVLNDIRNQVLANSSGARFIQRQEKEDLITMKTPFWILDVAQRHSVKYDRDQWQYRCVLAQGGDEWLLTLDMNDMRDRMASMLQNHFRDNPGDRVGPAILTRRLNRASGRMFTDIVEAEDAEPVPAPKVNPVELRVATSEPEVQKRKPGRPPKSLQNGPASPARPVAKPEEAKAEIEPPAPAQPVLTQQGGARMPKAPSGMTPMRLACGCLQDPASMQVFQPCAWHAGGQAPGPNVAVTTAVTSLTDGRSTTVCGKCSQTVTGDPIQIGKVRYLQHDDCPADPGVQALLRVS